MKLNEILAAVVAFLILAIMIAGFSTFGKYYNTTKNKAEEVDSLIIELENCKDLYRELNNSKSYLKTNKLNPIKQ